MATDKEICDSGSHKAGNAPRFALYRPNLKAEGFTRKMMNTRDACPLCHSTYTYQDGDRLVCPECSHEWSPNQPPEAKTTVDLITDAHGTLLQDGDAIIVIKDLKIKGSSLVVKVGTKVKNIRLTTGDHNIDCKIDGIGAMKLKSEFVKKI